MKITLAIDSSQRFGGAVALAAEGRLVAEVLHDPSTGYAESFFALADELLARAKLSAKEITQVAVITGPGSFTGLRIGVMTAKSLAYALPCSLVAAESLSMLALSTLAFPEEESETTVLALLEAGRSAVYATLYRMGAGRRETQRPAFRLVLDEVSALIDSLPRPLRVVSSGEAAVAAARAAGSTFAAKDFENLEVATLASTLALAAQRGDPWCTPADPSGLLPVYLGLSQAERAHGIDLKEEIHRLRTPRPGE